MRKTSVLMWMWNITKGQRVYTTVKPVQDLNFEKSGYTKPFKSKNQLNWQMIKKNTCTFPRLWQIKINYRNS